jgi:hypothetical protein
MDQLIVVQLAGDHFIEIAKLVKSHFPDCERRNGSLGISVVETMANPRDPRKPKRASPSL